MSSKYIDSDAMMALIQQQGQVLQFLVAKEIGSVNNDQEWQEKANSILTDLATKAPAAYGTANRLHGSTGTFSIPGLDRDVISAHVRPRGIAEVLPLFPSIEENPRYGALTGVSDDIGSEPANPCDDAPTGYIKACNLTAQFGRIARSTETVDFDEIGLKVNRGDFTDLMLHGFRLGGEVSAGMYPQGMDPSDILNIVMASQMVGVGERLYRKLLVHNWQGSPANNNAGGGYKEYPGLDNQVVTGQVDADTGTACAALDSDIKDFNYQAVGAGSGNTIVTYLSMLIYYLETLAEDTGLDPVKFVIAMRPQLFWELSAIWPIIYNTDKVAAATGNSRLVVNGGDMVQQRDAMRNGKYLVVNGKQYPVVTDPGIFEATNITDGNVAAGSYASSIYVLPLTINGNFPVLYRQHKDYRQMWKAELKYLRGKERFWTDDGVFSWALDDVLWCEKLHAKTEQRIVLRTPQLAGKIQNVVYSPLQHLREFDPDNPYHQNGGVSLRAASTRSAVWL
jgi:hypothetical protein